MTQLIRITTLTAVLFIAACGGDSGTTDDDAKVVNVYNWADYIDVDTLDQFEAETGIAVNYDTYPAAATVDVKLLTGNSGYDVVFHSNQLSSRLTEIGVYQKLDKSQLPNLQYLDPETMQRIDIYENVRGYYAPYHWGSTGLAWNVDLVRERLPDQAMDTTAVVFNPELLSQLADCGVSFLDGTTSLIPLALAYLGLDPNATDEDSLAQAGEMLSKVRPYVRYFSNDKYLSDLPNGEICVAMSWSGDYAAALRAATEAGIDIRLQYDVPKEGAPLWVDGIYIPADAPHPTNAHTFINFLMRPDIAAANAIDTQYATPNAAAMKLIDAKTRNNPAIYPDEEVWNRLIKISVNDPVSERRRTRTLARTKSGL